MGKSPHEICANFILFMGSKKVKRLGLTEQISDRLIRQNICTCKDVLSKTELELLKLLGASKYTVEDVIRRASQACTPRPVTAGDIWRSAQAGRHVGYLSTSLPRLDEVLHGVLPTDSITELAGPSGCGKTQFCLMLCVLATLPVAEGGLGGSVVYIDTESAFSAERLVEMAQTRKPEHFATEESLLRLTENIHVYAESTCASLLKRLECLEEALILHNVKLVVLDSVASLVRKEFDSQLGRNMIDRTNLLTRQAAILKYIAEEFAIPVVVTNQITTKFGGGGAGVVPLDEDQGRMEETRSERGSGMSLEGDSGYGDVCCLQLINK